MKVTNNAPRREGFHTKTGMVWLEPGQTLDLELTQGGFDLAKRLPFIGLEGVERSTRNAPATPVENAVAVDAPGYSVKDKGRGWFAVVNDGEEVTKSLREDDVAGFDGLSDEDKAAFVEQNAPSE